MDLATNFHQLGVANDSVLVISFQTPSGFSKWLVMAFRLTNAPAYFTDLMNRVFRDQLNKFVLVFVDDILVYSRTKEEHKMHLGIILDILRRNQLMAKFSKCHFWGREAQFLGYVVSKLGVVVDSSKVKAVQYWKRLENATYVRSFLGLEGYHRSFIKDFSKLWHS